MPPLNDGRSVAAHIWPHHEAFTTDIYLRGCNLWGMRRQFDGRRKLLVRSISTLGSFGMKSRLSAVMLSLVLAVSPVVFAQQAPATKGAGGQVPTQVETPAQATAGAAGAIGAAAIVGIAAAIAVLVAVSSANDDPDVLPPAPTGTTGTGTR
jgi:hypothetical protein